MARFRNRMAAKRNSPSSEPKGFKQIARSSNFSPSASVPTAALWMNPIAHGSRSMYQKRLSEDATPRQAALDTLKMILCSPSFLYLSEITPEDETLLRPYDLASRLSYALWAAPPDDEAICRGGLRSIDRADELKKQIVRLLDDERSDEFVSGFLDSWLNLRDIGNLPPPRKAAVEYYAENLPESMKQEARLFFRHLLDENGPVTDFLDADYTFVDKKLAKLYGLPERETLRLADGFQRVSLTRIRSAVACLAWLAC